FIILDCSVVYVSSILIVSIPWKNASFSPQIIKDCLLLVIAVYNRFLRNMRRDALTIGKMTMGNSLPCDLWMDIQYACIIFPGFSCVNNFIFIKLNDDLFFIFLIFFW